MANRSLTGTVELDASMFTLPSTQVEGPLLAL